MNAATYGKVKVVREYLSFRPSLSFHQLFDDRINEDGFYAPNIISEAAKSGKTEALQELLSVCPSRILNQISIGRWKAALDDALHYKNFAVTRALLPYCPGGAVNTSYNEKGESVGHHGTLFRVVFFQKAEVEETVDAYLKHPDINLDQKNGRGLTVDEMVPESKLPEEIKTKIVNAIRRARSAKQELQIENMRSNKTLFKTYHRKPAHS